VAFPSIASVIKSRNIRWIEHVADMEKMGNVYRFVIERCEENKKS
jgi:hypothetical protein